MVTLLYIIFFISCVALIASVLLQPGKADAGALFTSNISSTAFAPRGTQSILSKITIGAATVFMLTALLLSMPAITGDFSVLNSTTGTKTETTQAPQTESNSNTATVAPAETNNNATAPTNTETNTNTPVNK